MKEQSLIFRNFELEAKTPLSEEDLLNLLSQRIAEMLDHEPELLFSTLYRLDILEVDINRIFDDPLIMNDRGLAQLVLARQKQKQETKLKYKADDMDFWDFD